MLRILIDFSCECFREGYLLIIKYVIACVLVLCTIELRFEDVFMNEENFIDFLKVFDCFCEGFCWGFKVFWWQIWIFIFFQFYFSIFFFKFFETLNFYFHPNPTKVAIKINHINPLITNYYCYYYYCKNLLLFKKINVIKFSLLWFDFQNPSRQ